MKFRVDASKNFLILTDCTSLEYDQLVYSFTKLVDNYYIIKRKVPYWDGKISFFDSKFSRVPISLWREVQKLCKEFHFSLDIDGIEDLYDKDFDDVSFTEWVNTYFEEAEDLTPRDYQIEACIRLLKYRKCTSEIATSGGKTLVAFMIFKYLFSRGTIKKLLYIAPNINLVSQPEEKFYEYEDRCNKKPNWKSVCVYSGAKKDKDVKPTNITFGTYQSLTKKDLIFFRDFDMVIVDETHHAANNSIKKILVNCQNAKYKLGLTGTLPKEGSLNSFTIQSYLGPCVYEIKSCDLISSGKATPINIIGIELDYLDVGMKKKLYDLRNVSADEKDGVKLLNLEKDIVRDNDKRLKYVCETINKASKNSLVLFSDIKNEYGRKVYNWLRENSEKTIYYIDGSTDNKNRDYYKEQMEKNNDVIIVASVGTFGEGIDISNVFSLFIIESHKSENIIRQMLGRGMRLMEGKEKVNVIDFIDNFEYGTNKYQKINYLLRHAKARQQIYKDRGFPYKRYKQLL
jgi:superfamily II DNA or RNA helicase